MKKALAAVVAALILLQGRALADTSRSSILIEESTGRVLYQHNAHEPLPMASTTKIMTALLALEHAELDEPVTASRAAFGVPGTSMYLSEGETLTMEQMLYGLLLSSGNDAAVAIAEHIGGTTEEFCAMMTRRAEELGCENTIFMTPHGLPHDTHHTTAWDLALITREAMRHTEFRRIVSTARMETPWAGHTYNRVLTNKNKLLSTYEGATGVKTGYTKKAGRCLVFSAERNGLSLIGVVLNCYDWFEQARSILDAGFEKYEMVTLHHAGEQVGEVEIKGGVVAQIGVCAPCDLKAPMEKGSVPELDIQLPDICPAGVQKGDVVGQAVLLDGEEVLLTTPLLAMEGAPEADFRHDVGRVLDQWCAAAE